MDSHSDEAESVRVPLFSSGVKEIPSADRPPHVPVPSDRPPDRPPDGHLSGTSKLVILEVHFRLVRHMPPFPKRTTSRKYKICIACLVNAYIL